MDQDDLNQNTPDLPDRISQVQKGLYSRTAKFKSDAHHDLSPRRDFDIKTDWESEAGDFKSEGNKDGRYNPPKSSWMKKVFIGAAIFFVVAVGVAVYTITSGGNVVSNSNIDLQVAGPVSVKGGDTASLDISVTNNNPTALELADLAVEFPDGTRGVGDLNNEFKRYRKNLGNILPGQTVVQNVQAVLFGEENSRQNIKVTIEYRVPGSNAVFVKEKPFDVVISSAPISLVVTTVKDATSGQDVAFTIEATSNSTAVINNVMVQADNYPFGFTFEDASPAPTFGNNTWRLGDLAPGMKQIIKIKGKLEGQDGEERTFKFHVGIQSTTDERNLGATFLSSLATIAIKKPAIGIDLALDGDTSANYIATGGKQISGNIVWSNNTSDTITDLSIEARLSGTVLDKSSVSAESGFYRSIDNTIVWDSSSLPALKSIGPGEQGTLNFTLSSLPLTSSVGTPYTNPAFGIVLYAKGNQAVGASSSGDLITTLSRNIKIASSVSLLARAVHFSGSIINTGPMPPVPEQPTTYTIIWTVSNSSNDIANASVSATLPAYVSFTNQIDPTTEDLTFDDNTKTVIWNVGTVPAGTGFSKKEKQVSFQVSFLPSVSQVGTAPKLIESATLSGTDVFTNTGVQSTRPALTTRLDTDPVFRPGDENVASQ